MKPTSRQKKTLKPTTSKSPRLDAIRRPATRRTDLASLLTLALMIPVAGALTGTLSSQAASDSFSQADTAAIHSEQVAISFPATDIGIKPVQSGIIQALPAYVTPLTDLYHTMQPNLLDRRLMEHALEMLPGTTHKTHPAKPQTDWLRILEGN